MLFFNSQLKIIMQKPVKASFFIRIKFRESLQCQTRLPQKISGKKKDKKNNSDLSEP